MNLMPLLTIAAGSALGGMARYGISGWVQGGSAGTFPWGTLAVNVSGCLILGVLMRWLGAVAASAPWRLFFAIGFCGAYTTFSTFSFEAVQLMRDREWSAAVGYLTASVLAGLTAMIVGMAAAEWFLRSSRG